VTAVSLPGLDLLESCHGIFPDTVLVRLLWLRRAYQLWENDVYLVRVDPVGGSLAVLEAEVDVRLSGSCDASRLRSLTSTSPAPTPMTSPPAGFAHNKKVRRIKGTSTKAVTELKRDRDVHTSPNFQPKSKCCG
jgi:hypothetical protein